MTYLITGATSFLGVELTKTLFNQGHQVTAICRPNSYGLKDLPSQVKFVFDEMDEYCTLDSKIEKADVFIHLAWAGTGHGGRDDCEVQQQNIECSRQAMLAAHRMECKLFVIAGSQAEYGSTTEPQNEAMTCQPFSEYGKAKLRVREMGFDLAEQLGMKYMHLRIFSLIGENDHPWTLVMSCVDKMISNEPIDLSPCTQNWNFLYVKDAVRQIALLCQHALETEEFVHEIYNIASNDTRPLRDFVERVKELTGSRSDLHYGAVVPAQLVSLQPDMSKTALVVGKLSEYDFDTVIQRIMKKKSAISYQPSEQAEN